MEYRLDYVSRLFQKTSSKRIEHYVLTRIWHQLNDFEIKMMPQQYVSRHETKYALTDVYFPQIGFHVEVNEPAHYDSEEKIHQDNIRQSDIERKTGHQVFVIDCRGNLAYIHAQIDELVVRIQSAVTDKKNSNSFKPWLPENEHNPEYWKARKQISVSDEISFNTIEDICHLFGADPRKTKRGFLRNGAIYHPSGNGLLIWWPSAQARSGWLNRLDEDAGSIIETHAEEGKKVAHYENIAQESHTRAVFFHSKDFLGFTNYKFVGVFTNDQEKSNRETGTFWTRIGTTLNLDTLEIE